MFMHLSKSIFFFFLLGGAVLSLSADSWFAAWCGLELNLMSFIPFICLKKDLYTSESSLKYFLIQALGSALIVLSCICLIFMPTIQWIMSSALLLKMGAAPLHFWFPSVMSGLSWGSCMVLLSIQKIAPLGLLSYIVSEVDMSGLIMVSVIAGAIVGSVGGLNQVFLRKIMAYSSINHMSWIMVAMLMSDRSWMIYFSFYVFITGSVLYLFYFQQMSHISHMITSSGSLLELVTCLSLLSLGGLPPFTGFVPKWTILHELVSNSAYFVLVFLLAGTLVSLYYYLRLTLISFMFSSGLAKSLKNSFFGSKKMSFISFVSLMGLCMPSLYMFM